MEISTFRGGAAEIGRAQGSYNPAYIQGRLQEALKRPHNFEHPYFRKNMAFMRREFPEFMEQMEAFGEAVGFENFDHTYYLHIFQTGREENACSAFGILLKDDGPALLRCYDPSEAIGRDHLLRELHLAVFPDCKPHGFVGIGDRRKITVHTSVNDAGLLLGFASGVPKFNRHDNPEHVNVYLLMHVLGQYCGDCADVCHFLKQYRISGWMGVTGVAIDAKGNMAGLELESENIAFREPEDGMVLETNHWQHPDLQVPGRAAEPDFWKKPYYYNSQNRVQYFAYHREAFKKLRTLQDLIDYSFDVQEPGRLLQIEGYNIANWMTSHAIFAASRDRKMRVYTYPLDKNQYTEATCPV